MIRKTSRLVYASKVCSLGLLLVLSARAAAALTLHHIHGLSYSADGEQLYIPMHQGLAIYSGSHWAKAPGPEYAYMGLAITHEFFYSSGHPAPGSPLQNPFGLIKSKDGGQTWEHLTSPGDRTIASACCSGMLTCGTGSLKGLLLMAACW